MISQPVHVVALSGGKDSTAMALWLSVNQPRRYEFICNETGNELPAMRAHWDSLAELLGVPIRKVRHSSDLVGTIDVLRMLPSFHSRWCTRILKIEPTIDYFASLPAGSVLYVGLRADEAGREGLYGDGLDVRFPLRDAGFDEPAVWSLLADWGLVIPARTDCALCPYQRVGQWRELWRDHPHEFAQGVAIEERHGHTFRSPGRDTWPADLRSLAAEFASGRKVRPYVRKAKPDSCRVCSL